MGNELPFLLNQIQYQQDANRHNEHYIAALTMLNALPGSITDCKSIDAFKKVFKTNMLKSAFN